MAESAEKKKGAGRDNKSAAAFRTITEVANLLELPQHVLRFWETKFPQVKPMKRGGGRRYYRPEDVDLLRRIRDLLYEDGYTIKGVQKLLRENNGKAPAAGSTETNDAASAVGATGELTDKHRAELNALLGELESAREALGNPGSKRGGKKA